MTTQSKKTMDYRIGYADGIMEREPANPDTASPDYWQGYADGRRDDHFMNSRPGGNNDSLGDGL